MPAERQPNGLRVSAGPIMLAGMDPRPFPQAAVIEASLALLAERVGDPTPLVYARLFAAQPEMAALFCNDASGAVRGEMLARVFDTILDYIGNRSWAAHLLVAERDNHAAYGVPPAVFGTFFGTVAATVRDALGADWTPETAAAWDALLIAVEAAPLPS